MKHQLPADVTDESATLPGTEEAVGWMALLGSADFQSAVSQVSNLRPFEALPEPVPEPETLRTGSRRYSRFKIRPRVWRCRCRPSLRPPSRKHQHLTRHAFTLIELLVVIAVMGLLLALLLPALTRGKRSAERALCTSNLRQWGIALGAYAVDCQNYFPDNRDGKNGPSWCGRTVQNFWTNYLVPLVRSTEISKTHVLFCPTEKWHRAADLVPQVGQDGQLAIGYFLLPHRDAATAGNDRHDFDYNAAGLQGWVARQRFGGEFAKAPVAMDQMQALQTGRGNPPRLQWFGMLGMGTAPLARLPFSNHIRASGEPTGGNFLFEDGHVRWYGSRRVTMAATGGNWIFYYKIPLE